MMAEKLTLMQAVWRVLPILKQFTYDDLRANLAQAGITPTKNSLIRILRLLIQAGYLTRRGDAYVVAGKLPPRTPRVVGRNSKLVDANGNEIALTAPLKKNQAIWNVLVPAPDDTSINYFTLVRIIHLSGGAAGKHGSIKKYCNTLASVGVLEKWERSPETDNRTGYGVNEAYRHIRQAPKIKRGGRAVVLPDTGETLHLPKIK